MQKKDDENDLDNAIMRKQVSLGRNFFFQINN